MEKFDVFVLGTGTAGQLVAKRCAKDGLKVGIIDVRNYGGTCSQRGCDPKKLMLASSEAYQFAKDMEGDGISHSPTVDWNAAYNYARRYRKNIPENTVNNLEEEGITCYCGQATFLDKNTLQFNDQKIEAEKIVIATGRRPRDLEVEGAEHLKLSEHFFEMEEMPKSIIFIGAGYIAGEFSHMAARAGAKCTVLERSDSYLNNFEQGIVKYMDPVNNKLGIDIITNAEVKSVEKGDDELTVVYDKDGETKRKSASVVFNTSGRVPSLDGMFEKGFELTLEGGAIKVNEFMQSVDYDHIYACGDVSSHSLPLTPLSSTEAAVAATNVRGGNRKIETPPVPSVIFTIPQIANVGLTEERVKEEGYEYEVHQGDASDWFNNKRINADTYAYKILTEPDEGQIIGAHLIGPEAGEQINLFSLAMHCSIAFSDMKHTVYTYPSWANDIKSY